MDENPFSVEDGQMYMRFDAIVLRNTPDRKTGITLYFMWQGKAVYKQDVPAGEIGRGDTLEIHGIEGRMKATILLDSKS